MAKNNLEKGQIGWFKNSEVKITKVFENGRLNLKTLSKPTQQMTNVSTSKFRVKKPKSVIKLEEENARIWENTLEYYGRLGSILEEYSDVILEEYLDFDRPWLNKIVIKSKREDGSGKDRAGELHNAIYKIGVDRDLADIHEPIISYTDDV